MCLLKNHIFIILRFFVLLEACSVEIQTFTQTTTLFLAVICLADNFSENSVLEYILKNQNLNKFFE